MADMQLDNKQLEARIAEFAQDRQKEKYAKVMEALERSVVLVPTLPPQGLDKETERLMREGRHVQLPKEAKILPCLLRNETGEQALPIFTSIAQIPEDKKSPAVMAMPFHNCLSMVLSSQGKVGAMVLNPFTHNMVLPKKILDVAVKRIEGMKQTKTVKVTEKQFGELVHNRVAIHLLPKYLFEHKEDGLRKLQHEEGAFLLQFYRESYPEERRSAIPVSAEDFSVMTLNVTEDMQLTRVDMPDATAKKGMCYRAYAVYLNKTQEILYYTLEKTEQGNHIGQVHPDGKHELVEPVPESGAEIEAVMGLAARM